MSQGHDQHDQEQTRRPFFSQVSHAAEATGNSLQEQFKITIRITSTVLITAYICDEPCHAMEACTKQENTTLKPVRPGSMFGPDHPDPGLYVK